MDMGDHDSDFSKDFEHVDLDDHNIEFLEEMFPFLFAPRSSMGIFSLFSSLRNSKTCVKIVPIEKL